MSDRSTIQCQPVRESQRRRAVYFVLAALVALVGIYACIKLVPDHRPRAEGYAAQPVNHERVIPAEEWVQAIRERIPGMREYVDQVKNDYLRPVAAAEYVCNGNVGIMTETGYQTYDVLKYSKADDDKIRQAWRDVGDEGARLYGIAVAKLPDAARWPSFGEMARTVCPSP